MKNMNRILILVICLLLTAVISGAASAQQCTCLDASGLPYTERPADSTLCYQFDKDHLLVLVETLTYKQCETMNNAWLQEQELLRQQAAAEEAARQKAAAEEAARQKAAAEEAARAQAEAEAEAARQAEEAARQAAEEAARAQAEEAARAAQAEAEAAQRQAEEAARQAAEEAARIAQAEAEEAQRRAEEAARAEAEAAQRQAEEKAAADEEQRLAEAQAAAEEAQRQEEAKAAADEARRQAEEKAADEAGQYRPDEEDVSVQVASVEMPPAAAVSLPAAEPETVVIPVQVGGTRSNSGETSAGADIVNSENEQPVTVVPVILGGDPLPVGSDGTDDDLFAEPQIRSLNQDRQVSVIPVVSALQDEVNEDQVSDDGLLISPLSGDVVENQIPVPVITTLRSSGEVLSKSGTEDTDSLMKDGSTPSDDVTKKDEDIPSDDLTKKDDVIPSDDLTKKDDVIPSDDLTKKDDVIPSDDLTKKDDVIPSDDLTKKDDVIPSDDQSKKDDVIPSDDLTKKDDVIPSDDLTKKDDFIPSDDLTKKDDVIPSDDLTKKDDVIPSEDLTKKDDVLPSDDLTKKDGATSDDPSKKDDVTTDDEPVALSETALAELEQLLTEEQMKDLKSVITAEWLEEYADKLTPETYAELAEIVQPEDNGPADGSGSDKADPVIPSDDPDKQPVDKEDDASNPFAGLSEDAIKELENLLTEEQMKDLKSVITAEWLEEHADKLTAETYAKLFEINKNLLPVSDPPLKGPAKKTTEIEGKPVTIQLSSPAGGTVTTAKVPFEWNYFYNEPSSGKVDVEFTLTLTIVTGTGITTQTVNDSLISCSGGRCSYTADLSTYKDATITWDVEGTYKIGETTITRQSEGPRTFTLKIADPTPTPTPTPTPAPKPKPKAPVQECPIGRYIVRNLGFYWAPSENAESYLVEWWNNKGQKGSLTLSNSDVTCQNKRCIANATLPGVGHYAWKVTAKNASGSASSGEMKFEIASNISTPQAYRPDGTIVNRTYPSFEWEDVRDGAIEYRIQVVGKYDSRIRMDRWYSVKDIYVGKGLCYVKTDLFLPAGTYSWRVQARNKDFSSGWSAWRDFYVECDYCNYNNVYYNTYANTVPSCSYPVGTITVNKPEFQWRTLTGASYYMVKLLDSAGKTLFENQVPSSNCTIELCKWTPNYTLTKNGNYTWSVAGYGGNGALWNIAYGSFTYQGKPVMKAMSFLRPAQNGFLTNDAPVILWTDPGEGAALFHIEIFSNTGALLFSADLNREQAWCDGNTCSIEFKTIPDADNYRITVTPYSEFNTKGDMISLVFSKGGRVLKLSSPKEGAVVSTRPMFRWPLEYSESTAYELLLTDTQNNVTTISPLVCGAVGVTCEGGEAFYSPATALPVGNYTVRLTAAGINALSEEVHITVK